MSEIKLEINGKVVLVSGANRGIGKAIVVELLERGASKVYAGARNVASLDALKATYGDRVVPISLDVTNDHSIEEATKQIHDLDILINNAGVFSLGRYIFFIGQQQLERKPGCKRMGIVEVIECSS